MKVLIINSNWGGGGPGGIASDLYHVLHEQGHEVYFAYGRGNVPNNIKSYKIGSKFSLYFHALMSRLFDLGGFCSYIATKRLIKFIKKINPDVINLHNQLGYYLNIRLFLKYISKSQKKFFWTLHDCWAITGHCITGLCQHYYTKCGNCPRIKEYPKTLIDVSKLNYRKKKKMFLSVDLNSTSIISPSKWLYNLVENSFLQVENLYHIPNGIDLDVFKPTNSDLRAHYNLLNKKVYLAVASSWEIYKGAKYLYELTKYLNDSEMIVIIGKNNDKELVNNSKLIHIERTEDRIELAKWYTLADVFVNPTIGDNFPTVNIEALACGTPVVTFNTGGSPESIGHCGFVVYNKDAENLKIGIETVLSKDITSNECTEQAKLYNKYERYNEYINLFLKK